MDLKNSVVAATCEIFDTMLMTEVSPGEPLAERIGVFSSGISGMVGMAGCCRGVLAIHCTDAVAMSITGTFLGMDVESVDEDVKDAMGEMANMLAGSVKTSLAGQGKDVKLSIPTAICGPEYTLDCPENAQGVVMPFTMPAGDFLVELQLEEMIAD